MSGRGAYYKQLHSGRRRDTSGSDLQSKGKSHHYSDEFDRQGELRAPRRFRSDNNNTHGNSEDLLRRLRTLDGKSYPAYRDLQGSWTYPTFSLFVDYVQGDPYAPPSKFRVRIPHTIARFPDTLFSNAARKIALCDYITRHVCSVIETKFATTRRDSRDSGWGSEKGGQVTVDEPGQQVLERTSVVIFAGNREQDGGVELRFSVGLPARGRTILGDPALKIFSSVIPTLAESLLYSSQDTEKVQTFIDCIEDQGSLRQQIVATGLVAFVPNGANLPRSSGASDTPMASTNLKLEIIPFQSPSGLERTFVLPHRGRITGMAIPKGITMIAGGGFHGKSTLLDALAHGCYNHIPGDGREFLVTSPNCVSVQGEDGRAITHVDISPFISNLPGGVSTSSFCTQDASGSTSMAAGVIEAVELGADTLLFDEDTCATNFLIRDRRMQQLVPADPITPLVYKVRAMFRDRGCSSILVIGGCGDYCDVADVVLEMREYKCYDITAAAQRVVQELPSAVRQHEDANFNPVRYRHLQLTSLPSPGTKLAVRKRTAIDIGTSTGPGDSQTLDLSALVQLAHNSQTRAIAAALKRMHEMSPGDHRRGSSPPSTLPFLDVLRSIDGRVDERGLDTLADSPSDQDRIDGFLARPRLIELGMAVNRLRSVVMRYLDSESL